MTEYHACPYSGNRGACAKDLELKFGNVDRAKELFEFNNASQYIQVAKNAKELRMYKYKEASTNLNNNNNNNKENSASISNAQGADTQSTFKNTRSMIGTSSSASKRRVSPVVLEYEDTEENYTW